MERREESAEVMAFVYKTTSKATRRAVATSRHLGLDCFACKGGVSFFFCFQSNTMLIPLCSGVDDSLYTGEIIYHNLTGNDYWRVDMESVNINGQVLSTGKNLSAIIDTGSTLLTGPTEQVKAFYSHIPGSSPTSYEGTDGFYQFPCANADQFDVQLTFNGVSYPIDYDDMIFRPVTNGTADIEDGMCFGAMFGYDFDNINWIIGDTFLKNVVSVFQYDPPAVGFATPVTHRAGWYGANKKGAGRKTQKGPHRQDNHW